ncbi:hypothetical protein [Candidatus Mycobacterium methanotrophicum]
MLNSAGLVRVGLAGHPDGRLRSTDSWSDALSRGQTELAELSARLSGYGVTGITDATPELGAGDIVRSTELRRRGELRQQVHCLAPGKRILHDDDLDLERLAPSGAVLGTDECISARTALSMFFGYPAHPTRARTLQPGEPGDLCVLSLPPEAALAELDAGMVAATIVDGQITYAAE